jgi:hypothetical protein
MSRRHYGTKSLSLREFSVSVTTSIKSVTYLRYARGPASTYNPIQPTMKNYKLQDTGSSSKLAFFSFHENDDCCPQGNYCEVI